MLVSSGLALASALVAALLIGDRRFRSTSTEPYPSDQRQVHRGCCVPDDVRKLPVCR
jgi:hypothetical protein